MKKISLAFFGSCVLANRQRVSRRLNFSFDPEKFVNATAYLVERCPEVTRMKLSKLLYFADKEHLLEYGRTITGDRYIRMEHGPVPSAAYNLMKRDERASSEDQNLFDGLVGTRGNDLFAKCHPNLAHLSETDIEILDQIIRDYGHLTAKELRDLSHRERAWIDARENSDMDYRLLFAGRPEAETIKQLAQEHQLLQDAIDDAVTDECLVSA